MSTLNKELEGSLAIEGTKPYTPRAQREQAPTVKVRPSLYDIGEDAMAINDLLREAEGELTPELEARLDALLADGANKLDAAAWVVRQLSGSAEACKLEAKRYRDRADAYERNVDALKARMLFVVETAFSGKLKTDRNTIWSQTSATTVSFDVAPDADLEKVAQENGVFVRRRYELDKLALKNYHDAGEPIPSEIVVTENPGKTSLRIR